MLFTSERTLAERTLADRPPPGEANEGGIPFLAIRHVSRLNQGNYGVKRTKRPLALVKSHISRRDTSDIGATRELKTFDEPRDVIFTSSSR
jgi:hypothetical protein